LVFYPGALDPVHAAVLAVILEAGLDRPALLSVLLVQRPLLRRQRHVNDRVHLPKTRLP